MAESADLKSVQCGFESHCPYQFRDDGGVVQRTGLQNLKTVGSNPTRPSILRKVIMSDQIISEELMQYITRIETIEAELEEKKIDRKEVYAELKSVGYVPKTVRQIIRLRKLEAHVRLEEEALLDTYKNAVGL